MPAQHNYYFLKLHYDIIDDWKVGTLPDSLKWRFIQCLCVAGEYQKKGLLPDINHFAYRIRQEPQSLNSDMMRLAQNELVELVQTSEGERWYITNYEKRQKKIPNDQRQRDYRNRQKQKKIAENNNSVTELSRKRYDSVTIRNTELELELELEEEVEVEKDNAHAENQPPMEVMSEIAAVVKTTLAPGFNENAFEKAAHVIISLDAVDRIPGFAAWWQRNSWYDDNGKAALKTFIDEFQNYLDGVERSSNGQRKPQSETKHLAGSM
jgi:hypothetical protein